MDFIERIFHVAPDSGSGFLELAIAIAVIAIPVVIFMACRSIYFKGRL